MRAGLGYKKYKKLTPLCAVFILKTKTLLKGIKEDLKKKLSHIPELKGFML